MPDLPVYNHIQLELTSRCNLRCRTCLYGHYPERWVAADLAPAVFDRILAVAPRIHSIHLQGWGESLLREDCPELIGRVKQAGLAVSISSNGGIMSPALARALIDAGLDSMAFSFAGTSPREQDPLRGAGSFEKAVEAAAVFSTNCKASRPPVLMNYLLIQPNRSSLHRALRLTKRLGMNRLQVGHLVHPVAPEQADWPAYPETVAGPQRMFWLRLSVLWHRTALGLPSMKGQPTAVCPKNPLENLFVGADGTVSPCVYLNPPLNSTIPRLVEGGVMEFPRVIMGRLTEQNLDDIWNQPAYRRFRYAFEQRVKAYAAHMAGIRPDLDGLAKLERSVDRLRALFSGPLRPPEACRLCPHLQGF
jgi:MoaA/NifB/PqqE/SkfB family radical SAM enzyme